MPLDDYEIEKVLFRLDAGKEGKISYQLAQLVFTLYINVDNTSGLNVLIAPCHIELPSYETVATWPREWCKVL